MPPLTEPVTAVRALPLILARDAGGASRAEPAFAEIVFVSAADGLLHQAYVDGRLAGCTRDPADRSLIVPVDADGPALVEVVAVDPADRHTDFADQLSGASAATGSRVRLSWAGGRYLDDALDHFDVYGGPAGSIDYAAPLNAEPIPATVNALNLGGFGRGGYGRGGLGRSAMTFRFTTAPLGPGPWSFEVVAVDAAGNAAGGPAARIDATVLAPPRPPEEFALADYDPATRAAALAWTPSPDVVNQML